MDHPVQCPVDTECFVESAVLSAAHVFYRNDRSYRFTDYFSSHVYPFTENSEARFFIADSIYVMDVRRYFYGCVSVVYELTNNF